MDKRVKRTIRLIKNGVYKHYILEEGYSLTVKDLCKKIKINRTTFYLHYTSLEDVVAELQKDFLLNIVTTINMKAEHFSDRVFAVCNFIKNSDSRHVKLFKISEPKTHAIIKEILLPVLLKEIPIKDLDETSYDYLIEYILNGCIAIFYKWVINGCKDDYEKLYENLQRYMHK